MSENRMLRPPDAPTPTTGLATIAAPGKVPPSMYTVYLPLDVPRAAAAEGTMMPSLLLLQKARMSVLMSGLFWPHLMAFPVGMLAAA